MSFEAEEILRSLIRMRLASQLRYKFPYSPEGGASQTLDIDDESIGKMALKVFDDIVRGLEYNSQLKVTLDKIKDFTVQSVADIISDLFLNGEVYLEMKAQGAVGNIIQKIVSESAISFGLLADKSDDVGKVMFQGSTKKKFRLTRYSDGTHSLVTIV